MISTFLLLLLPKTSIRWTGGDVTFIPQVERNGGVYRSSGKVIDPLVAMKRSGQNLARIRLWNDPADGDCGLPQVIALAKRCKKAGLQILLDFHYSDTWADPAHQITPRAWKDLDAAGLTKAVHDFTLESLKKMDAAGVRPDMVQVGNEVTGGMLWPLGKYDKFDNLAAFLRAGLFAVKEVSPSIITMVHIDRGGDVKSAHWFYSELKKRKVEYDLIGLSYYPWWQGTLTKLATNLEALSSTFGKDIVVVETAYPWTIKPDSAAKGRIAGDAAKLLPPFPASPQGQADFLKKLTEVVAATPNGHGVGVVYWAPDWLETKVHSPWDNLTWYDTKGNLLPGARALVRWTAP
jgi:arabinogalactan endo-1,4-beta-galactosidase